MLSITTIGLVSLGMFYMGYYFGNQMGRTESIRNHLTEVRSHNTPR